MFISLCHECLSHFSVSVLSDSLSLLRAVSFVLRVLLYGGRTGGFWVDSPWKEFPLGKEGVPPTPEALALIASVEDDHGDGKCEDGEESGEGWLVNIESV